MITFKQNSSCLLSYIFDFKTWITLVIDWLVISYYTFWPFTSLAISLVTLSIFLTKDFWGSTKSNIIALVNVFLRCNTLAENHSLDRLLQLSKLMGKDSGWSGGRVHPGLWEHQ